MKMSLRSATAACSIVTLVASLAVPLAAKAAGTPAGTSIVNQATSTYNDTAGNGYVSVSNKVTTVVQNAPSVTFTAGTVQATVPGGQLTDTFTLTNTGNAAAYFTLANAGTTGIDGASQTIAAYEVTLPAAYVGTLPAGCTELGSTFTYSCTTLGTSGTGGSGANLLLYNTTEAPGSVVTIGVVYNVAAGANAGTIAAPNTIVTNLTASATQAAGTGTLVTTSTALASADTDDVVSDARVDVQKYGVQPNTPAVGDMPANATANIEYQITSADGGSVPVRDLASVKTLLGSGANGVFFSDKIPSFTPTGSSTATLAAIQSAAVTTSTANGFGASSSATIYYQTQGSTTWTAYTSGAFPANVTYIGVLVSGTPLAEYGTNNNGTSQGVVPTAKSAVTLTFYVSPPSGTGSGNANAYLNSVDAVSGGDQPNLNPDSAVPNPAQNVVGPGVATGTADSTTAIDSGAQGILYPTGTSVSASSAINESNTVGNQASVTGSVLNGPFGVPGAIGSYNGVAAASNNNDNTATAFTPIGFVPTDSGTSPPATASAPSGNQLGAAATITVPNTLQNIGNSVDSITVTVAAPAGFTAQIFAASVLGVPVGVSLSGAAANTATYTFPLVPSGGTGDVLNQVSYAVTYTVPATATAFTPYDAVLTATSGNSATSNVTHNDLIPGGPIALFKAVSYDATTCTGGLAVPGCIMTYSITYLNNAAAASACPSTPPTVASVPAYLAAYYSRNLLIAENGGLAPSTWGATYANSSGTHYVTSGLNAPATDTTTGSTFTTNTTGSYAFSDLVGGSANYVIAPGCSGTVSFKVTVATQ